MASHTSVFITGASGFIGGKLAERLLAQGRRVRALSRRPLPGLEKLGAKVIIGDLHDATALASGCTGADTVFHVAGRVGVWGPANEFFRVNVGGTQNVLAAARAAGVPCLVYTSSPSVVYNGGDLAGTDESAPLCTQAPCAYPTSKAAAEKLVLEANIPGFATTALRPHLVWGPGDKNVVPRVLALAKKRRLKIVGSGRNRVDLTHIENVLDAHLLAEKALTGAGLVEPGPGSSPPATTSGPPAQSHVLRDFPPGAVPEVCHVIRDKPARPSPHDCHLIDDKLPEPGPAAGRAYFITNGEPVVLWDWINELLRGLGRPPVTQTVSLRTAYLAGSVLEALWRVLPLEGEPPMTRFVAKELATDHWFDISAARRNLGYTPRVSMTEGTAALIAHLRIMNQTNRV